ncbi:hypothetical protein ABIC83_002722 [Roseateles asaccharophilus]|uniref:hypothetical protein n=1 Tax=Roseateles asaccharophilus TaxID=582607 RepID=UPI0038331508
MIFIALDSNAFRLGTGRKSLEITTTARLAWSGLAFCGFFALPLTVLVTDRQGAPAALTENGEV